MIAAQFPSRRSVASRGPAELKARFERDRTLMLVAKLGGAAVGGALAHQAGDAVEVDVIALRPEARRLGIGRQLMEAIESEAICLGAQAIFLGGANADNRGFYRRLGFAGRKSLMHKGLPLAIRFAIERRRALTIRRNVATPS